MTVPLKYGPGKNQNVNVSVPVVKLKESVKASMPLILPKLVQQSAKKQRVYSAFGETQ